MTTTRSVRSTGPVEGSGPGGRDRRGVSVALGSVGILLVLAGWLLPIWQARLHAPQYPGGLTTVAYGHQVVGDINEVNALNHYVGLGVFDPADVPEMRLWPHALAVAVVAVGVAALGGRRPRRLALLYLWALPVGVLGAIQYRLFEFGQDITPGAAFKLDPFVPLVVGRSTVWNFETWAWPGWGLLAIVAAAALLTFAPRLLDRRSGGAVPGRAVAGVVLVVGMAAGSLVVTPHPAVAQHHDHGGHDRHEDATVHDGPPAPVIGPERHPTMPTVLDHPHVGDLQPLLDALEPGARLRLRPGTYAGPVVIDRPVVIEGIDLPVIEGDGRGSVITVRAPGTVIRGVVVRGSGAGPTANPAGIRIEADDVTVEATVVEDSYLGIAVDGAAAAKLVDNHLHGRRHARIVDEGHAVDDAASADHATHDERPADGAHDHAATGHDGHGHDVHGHDGHGHDVHGQDGHDGTEPASRAVGTPGRGDGIWLHDVDHVLVRGNQISHARDGIYVAFGAGAVLDGNHVHHSRYAVHTMFARELSLVQNHFTDNLSGAVLMYGSDVLLLRNHVERSTSASTGFGAILKDIGDVELVQNVFVGNRVGLHLDGPTRTSLTANTIASHAVGLQAHSSVRATLSGNSFVDNTVQVIPLGGRFDHVSWTERGWGNYWSTYRGYDANGQGKGAVPHAEGGAVDRLLARHPELLAIADAPAMRLLRSVEERWGRRAPALVDERPLTVPVSPLVPVAAAGDPAGAGAVLLAAGLVLPTLVVSRRPRRHQQRSPRVHD